MEHEPEVTIPQTKDQVRTGFAVNVPSFVAKNIILDYLPSVCWTYGIFMVVWLVLLALAIKPLLTMVLCFLFVATLFALLFGFVMWAYYLQLKANLRPYQHVRHVTAFDPLNLYMWTDLGASSTISLKLVKRVDLRKDCLIIQLQNKLRLYISEAAFESPADLQTALTYLRQAGKLK